MDTNPTPTGHDVQLTRTTNERPDVGDALHLRCTCGWTSSASDEANADALTREHRQLGDPNPVPATISPD